MLCHGHPQAKSNIFIKFCIHYRLDDIRVFSFHFFAAFDKSSVISADKTS